MAVHAPDIARCIATREGSSQDWETTTMVAHSLRGTEPLNVAVRQARATSQTGYAGKAADDKERSRAHPMAVRRLTVEECESLQGFPRGYTAIPWRGKPADQCPDGPRYKALGNSWAVPNVRWIAKRIDDAVKKSH